MKQTFQDDSWLNAFQEGNAKAFQEVFNRYNKRLCYFAEQKVQDRKDAEDIVADTFGKLWQGHAGFNSEESIRAFLYITTRNACISFLRQKHRREASGQELLYLFGDKDDGDALHDMIEAELLEIIYQAIEELPRKCKAIFKLIYFEGLSTKEVAEKLRISERNVLNQKARAIQLLKRNLLMIIGLYLILQLDPHLHQEILLPS